MKQEKTQVVIVGGGPNGITAAHSMGIYGIDCVVLELADGILPYPRAVGMDDEALRVLQGIGIADLAVRDMICDVPLRYYNARGVCFAEVKPSTAHYGWPMRNIFMQQLLEGTLREHLGQHPCVELRQGHELFELEQDAEGVTLQVRDAHGELYQLRADYVIGADGGRSTVRKQLGVELLGLTHPRKWVVVDTANDTLDAPFTALHADPQRPFVCIYLPYQQRRWEFMLMEGEDEAKMCEEATIRQLIHGHIGDAVNDLNIIRIRAYTHHSRVAARFVEGRVALVGDAAHISPPWAGQGLNSGLRDVANVAWKLAAIIQGRAAPSILASYDQERRGHATELVSLADNMGAVLGLTNPLMAGVRDWLFQAVNTVDNLRSHLLEFKFKPKATITKGLVHHERAELGEDDLVGQLFIQPNIEDAQGQRRRLDEVLGNGYAVLGYRVNPRDHLSEPMAEYWARWETRFIQVNRSRSGVGRNQPLTANAALSVEDVDNRLGQWFSKVRDCIVVVRPDRFVAAITTPERLDGVLRKLAAQLS
ncbi:MULTISPECIES: bifunctional 3-(3-hydroxy-phenyl)propionate/3-hydroxycinnamic acid hydroxylase [unclassified Pseudomonas]|uniref:bifunctional 3-(3-hydroxy-phenyl)propionate/3-hydroxycinnamic acid hydroxylase n=1 Tax=unclassified Pseudomonas TaxID=196821 RepID=UPI0008122FC1|nr:MULTISPECIES: bifunctional 3-(3-hydroxy-phenyl)propionate/3-hydroxycinnamic acid hydroxylase [unclassified Pseudomonas]CRM34222.1 3-(3-hydroxy-phenyl)propionate/3-hydroxycinnamic acid hydroxylase [Pseudomonas sp. 52 E 6]CRM51337.1 3-(3-hydroxy-phenyl)propionate/3-hydroxycinnamic acid hydroxylase [Pseudomonas sp. 24 E 1]CRM53060.1 3-(3-hydroxy-phenyl)propionate/3-hydroxycinnamic acid hydroxylase [Pseudomonas sp. 24 R 17]CRM67331.1 3-(3-hydroxy-phenyl)propionate/3-hydroxycinnamic acid hydroxyl